MRATARRDATESSRRSSHAVKVSVLTLVPASRARSERYGVKKRGLTFFDYAVDGVALRPVLSTEFIGLLSDEWPGSGSARALVLEQPENPRMLGRVRLYGCPECLDINCGGIATRISRDGDRIRWDRLEEFQYDVDSPDVDF